MRSVVSAQLPDTCHLLTETQTANGQGGFTSTWGTATYNVACRLDSYRGSEKIVGDRTRDYHSFVLTLPYDTTITTDYRVEIGTATYAVTSEDTGKSWTLCKRLFVELI